MEFEKNADLILNICQVLVRSVDDVVELPSLTKVYHTPSKITYSSRGQNGPNGNLYTKNLRLTYPGFANGDFEKFDALIKGIYQVYIVLENGEYHEVATDRFPMTCSTDFSVALGHELVFSSTAPVGMNYLTTVDPGESIPGGIIPDEISEMFDYDLDFNLA